MIVFGLWILLIVCLIVVFIMIGFLYYSVIAGIFSAPFVPTSAKDIDRVLAYAKLKPGTKFVDLGCGDGRIILEAVKNYQVKGVGVELNPFLIWFARLTAKFLKLKNALFLRQNLYQYSLTDAEVIYIFLMPKMLKKMVEKMRKECKRGTLIISRGFEVPGLKQIHVVETKTFWTYFYRI